MMGLFGNVHPSRGHPATHGTQGITCKLDARARSQGGSGLVFAGEVALAFAGAPTDTIAYQHVFTAVPPDPEVTVVDIAAMKRRLRIPPITVEMNSVLDGLVKFIRLQQRYALRGIIQVSNMSEASFDSVGVAFAPEMDFTTTRTGHVPVIVADTDRVMPGTTLMASIPPEGTNFVYQNFDQPRFDQTPKRRTAIVHMLSTTRLTQTMRRLLGIGEGAALSEKTAEWLLVNLTDPTIYDMAQWRVGAPQYAADAGCAASTILSFV